MGTTVTDIRIKISLKHGKEQEMSVVKIRYCTVLYYIVQAELASIHSEEELDFISELSENSRFQWFWVGGYREMNTSGSNWVWSDSTAWNYRYSLLSLVNILLYCSLIGQFTRYTLYFLQQLGEWR